MELWFSYCEIEDIFRGQLGVCHCLRDEGEAVGGGDHLQIGDQVGKVPLVSGGEMVLPKEPVCQQRQRLAGGGEAEGLIPQQFHIHMGIQAWIGSGEDVSSGADQGMLPPDSQKDLLFTDGMAGKLVVVSDLREKGYRNIKPSFGQVGQQDLRLFLCDIQGDVGVERGVFWEEPGQNERAAEGGDSYIDFVAAFCLQSGQLLEELPFQGADLLDIGQIMLSGGSKLQRRAVMVKQLHIQPGFQAAEVFGKGWLGDVQLFSGPG